MTQSHGAVGAASGDTCGRSPAIAEDRRARRPGQVIWIVGVIGGLLLLGTATWFLTVAWRTPTVVVGSKAFPESRLLSEIIAQLIEADLNCEVRRRHGLGGTLICFKALRHGNIDLYPEYSGTGLVNILKEPPRSLRGQRAILNHVRTEFRERFALEWCEPFGFRNDYAIAVRRDSPLQRISDLASVQETVRAGFQHEFLDREDGYPGLAAHYQFSLHDVKGMEHALCYMALDKQQIDVMEVYTTDGMLKKYPLRMLEDDREFFPPYDAAPLVRQAALAEFPGLRETLGKLAGRITQEKMIDLNYQVVEERLPVRSAARQFLIAEELIGGNSRQVPEWWLAVKELLRLLGEHLFLTLTATTLATACGVSLGMLIARRGQQWAAPVLAAVGVLQTIPSLAMLAFMIPLLQIGAIPAIAAIFLYALLPVVRNTYTGITGVSPGLREAGLAMGMTQRQLLWQLEIPLSMKTIMAGIRTALVISVGTATLGAFIGAGGFGDPINSGLQQDDNRLILWGAVPAAVLALVCDWGMAQLEKRLEPRGLRIGK